MDRYAEARGPAASDKVMDKIIEVIVAGGPTAIAGVLAILLVYVNKERVKQTKTVARLHEEKENMYREWLEENGKLNERLHTALSNSTIAMTANTASSESLKQGLNGVSGSLQAVIGFIGVGRGDRHDAR